MKKKSKSIIDVFINLLGSVSHIRHLVGRFIYIDPKGYPRFKATNKLVHRAIAESKLGGKIWKNCVVHHKDGDKGNFLKENLQVMSRKAHAILHANLRKKK